MRNSVPCLAIKYALQMPGPREKGVVVRIGRSRNSVWVKRAIVVDKLQPTIRFRVFLTNFLKVHDVDQRADEHLALPFHFCP